MSRQRRYVLTQHAGEMMEKRQIQVVTDFFDRRR